MIAFNIWAWIKTQWIWNKLRNTKLIKFKRKLESIVEFYIRPFILRTSIKHLHGLEHIDYTQNELIVTCVVRNGELYVKSFIEHYLVLGVKHIVFLDNGSTDNTVALASAYENVTILQTRCPYQIYETIMKRYLVKRFSQNRWNLFVDIDELFDYPFSDKISLNLFLEYLHQNSYTAVVAQMLDLFADKSLASLTSSKNDSIKEIYKHYDISNIKKYTYPHGKLSNQNVYLHQGGIRKTLFNTDNGLTKAALIFVNDELIPFVEFHHVENAYIADLTTVLLHYPFVSSFAKKVEEAVRTDRYKLSASQEYKMYWERLKQNPSIDIKQETSQKLDNINSLLDNGFLFGSNNYKQWVERHTQSHSNDEKIKPSFR